LAFTTFQILAETDSLHTYRHNSDIGFGSAATDCGRNAIDKSSSVHPLDSRSIGSIDICWVSGVM
jgi:hypothetical protein